MNSTHHLNDEIIALNVIPTMKYYDDENENHRDDLKEIGDPDEEITGVLTTENSRELKDLVIFNNHERQFKPIVNTEELIIHHSYEGNLIPIDSDEAKYYLQKEKSHGQRIRPIALLDVYKNREKVKIELEQSDELAQISTDDDEQRTIASDVTEQSELNEPIDDPTPLVPIQSLTMMDKPKKILNRFNFCEQGIQTNTPSKKDVSTLTDAIPRKKFVGLANQRIIYQEYLIDYEKQQKDKDKRKQKVTYGSTKGISQKRMVKTEHLNSEAMVKHRQVQILKTMERVLNQNRYKELIYNFKYFEDKTDETHDLIGSLFPLWKFPPSMINRSVTALTWNPIYSDMLIIGYGFYNPAERVQGTIAVFTLNNSYPDTLIHTESSVLSIDCLPSKPYLICVGLMDGEVIVYDISIPSGKAVFINPSYTCKHLGCVWQVRWCTPSSNDHLRFCSAASDGKVMRWTCIKGELRPTVLLNLPSAVKATRLDDGTLLTLPGPAMALDFHRQRKDVFLVGTEDGKIYKGSINDPGMIDATFNAHEFAVHAVQWSPFHPHIFASCSADGTIKIWHEKTPEYVIRFDLCTSLQDFAWSPYTSTTFAVAGADGKVYIFDIHSNKLEPICEQLLAKETNKICTKIAFNPIHPILLAGDETGWALCLKLSPNLRKKAKIRKGIEVSSNSDPELDKLAEVLSRTIVGESINDLFLPRMTHIED